VSSIRWGLYKRISPRFAVLVGVFVSTLEYAGELEARACASWRPNAQRRRADTYQVRLAMGKAAMFIEGW